MNIPQKMRAMVFSHQSPLLYLTELDTPMPNPNQVLIKVHACGVCRTDLHIVDHDLTGISSPLILGHEIVGTIVKKGNEVNRFNIGDRVGVPWLGHTCGTCYFCQHKKENLCETAQFTGYNINGGYAEFTLADQQYTFVLPPTYTDLESAPLLCAGLIGYRSYSMVMEHEPHHHLGIYGFGAAGHIIAQIALFHGQKVYAFTRPGDHQAQKLADDLGVSWAGDSTTDPPVKLDAAIIFAPVGSLIPSALQAMNKGGIVVCAGIHMSDIPSFPYNLLWEERIIRSVANLTRKDGEGLMDIAAKIPLQIKLTEFPFKEANQALHCLRSGEINGAAVLSMK